MESKATDEGLKTLKPLLDEIKQRFLDGDFTIENPNFTDHDYYTGDCNFGNLRLRCSFNEKGYICHHDRLGDCIKMTNAEEAKVCKMVWKYATIGKLYKQRDDLQKSLEVVNKRIEKYGNAI